MLGLVQPPIEVTMQASARGAGSRAYLASGLQEGRQSASIHAISGVIRGIPVKYFLGGIGLASSISGTRKDNVEV